MQWQEEAVNWIGSIVKDLNPDDGTSSLQIGEPLNNPGAEDICNLGNGDMEHIKSGAQDNNEHGKDQQADSITQSWAYTRDENDPAAQQQLATWLNSIPFFAKIDPFCFERLLLLFERHRFRRGQKVLEEGTVTNALHVVFAGKADVLVHGETINTIGPNTVIGERCICAFASEPPKSNASIVVATPHLITAALARGPLLSLMQRDPWIYRQLEDAFDTQRHARGEESYHTYACLTTSTRILQSTYRWAWFKRCLLPVSICLQKGTRQQKVTFCARGQSTFIATMAMMLLL